MPPPRTPHVFLTTEGTYPFILGGVSTWCDALLHGLEGVDFSILAVTAGGIGRPSMFPRRTNIRSIEQLDLWSEEIPFSLPLRKERAFAERLPEVLAQGILRWDGDLEALLDALVWCRSHPRAVRWAFRRPRAWTNFLRSFEALLAESGPEFNDRPTFDMLSATDLYRLLFWVAQAAAFPTPVSEGAPDLLLSTAAGWAAIPCVVHKAIHDTPFVLNEHGVYVREAYLGVIRNGGSASSQFVATRVARGLARLAYRSADMVTPVTEANGAWEQDFGVAPEKIRTIYNGVIVPPATIPAPERKIVVAVGRIDPLKDLKTMLRCAAAVIEQDREARFLHFGPVPPGNESYKEECDALHRDLGLGERFEFCGSTSDPYGAVARGDVSLLTSISEGSPITVLEAMANARPIVATAVGGVPEAMFGCGFTARPGDHQALAVGVLRLIEDPALAGALGSRAYHRASTVFGQATCLDNYRKLISELTNMEVSPPRLPNDRVSSVFKVAVPEVGDHTEFREPAQPGAEQFGSIASRSWQEGGQ